MAKLHHILGQAACAALLAGAPAGASGPNFISDVIIEGSLCVGFDCVPGMAFGYDTIVLRENNLRIFFDDSSTVTGFPNNDWRFVINNSSINGYSFFALEDASAVRTPFRVEAGARSNALYVEDSGEVGIGTNSPVGDVHIKIGDTPTVRLEQDGSSGFTAQTWDVAGNEATFFIRDATSGSQLPFRIEPGTATNTLYLDSAEKVGIGTSSPTGKLHVATDDTEALTVIGAGAKHIDIFSTDMNAAQLRLISDSGNRNIIAQDAQTGGAETRIAMQATRILLTGTSPTTDQWLRVEAAGITTPGTVTSGGPTCGGGCDAVFDPEVYTVPSIEEHAAAMWERGHLPAVGPTVPGAPVNLSEQYGRVLNELEHAHIYIDQLHRRLVALEAGKD